MFVSLVLASQLLAGGFNLASATSKPALGQSPQDLSVLTNAQPSRTIWDMAATFTNRIASGAFKFPDCLRRFNEYPPDGGKLGFPRCLFENPFPTNPDFWLKDVDFSCASPWTDECGRLRAGTAISRRHIVFAKHFPIPEGARMLFVGVNGDTSPYYVQKTQALDSCDIMLGLLNAELTPDVTPAKVLPPYALTNAVGRATLGPVVTLNQHELASLAEVDLASQSPNYGLVSFNRYEDPALQRFNVRMRTGDSGSPTFLIVDRKPVLLFCLTTSRGGYDFRYFHREVQSAMDALCPGYKLECLDLGE